MQQKLAVVMSEEADKTACEAKHNACGPDKVSTSDKGSIVRNIAPHLQDSGPEQVGDGPHSKSSVVLVITHFGATCDCPLNLDVLANEVVTRTTAFPFY